jgi:hypothetical protein
MGGCGDDLLDTEEFEAAKMIGFKTVPKDLDNATGDVYAGYTRDNNETFYIPKDTQE